MIFWARIIPTFLVPTFAAIIFFSMMKFSRPPRTFSSSSSWLNSLCILCLSCSNCNSFLKSSSETKLSVLRSWSLSYNREHFLMLTYLIWRLWVHMTSLFTECVTKSCDSPYWLIQNCYQFASSHVTETAFFTKCFQKFFSVHRKSYHCIAKYCNTNHCYCLATKGYLIYPQTDYL